MEVEEHLLYTKEHEWVNIEDDIASVGITDYAQGALGDITFVELPNEGDQIEQFGQYASVESVKAASDIFSPVSGEIVEVNTDLADNPGLINKYPYSKGWIAKIRPSDLDERSSLLTADEYRSFLESEG